MTATPALKNGPIKLYRAPTVNMWVILEILYGFLLQFNYWSQFMFIPFFTGTPLVCMWLCWQRLAFLQLSCLIFLVAMGANEVLELRQEREPLWEEQTKRMSHELKTIDPLTSILYESIGPDMVAVTKIQQYAGISSLTSVQKKFKQLLCELSKDIISDVFMFLLYGLLIWVIVDGLSFCWVLMWSGCAAFYGICFVIDGL